MERLQWLTPLLGIETLEWSSFINYAMEIDRASPDQGSSTLAKVPNKKELSMPDTLQKAEESSLLPHQLDETSSAEEK